MNREHGYTLIETLVTMVVVVILGASGLYGWQSWQQQQRLWQTACQVRDYLVLLRDDANWHNRDRVLSVDRSAEGWCLSVSGSTNDCSVSNAFTLQPLWPEVSLSAMTPGLGFYGLRNTAWRDISACKARRAAGILSFPTGGESACAAARRRHHVCKTSRFFAAGNADRDGY